MVWLALALALTCGCGRIGFAPSTDATGPAGDTTGDTTGAISCWPAWATGAPVLSPPVRVAELSIVGVEDKDLGFGADDLEI